jgi:DNA-directed RNA polymerase subunit RPC12/RpoP
MECPHCGRKINLKGHVRGTKGFPELTRTQQRSAIAKAARNLKDMRRIYHAATTTTR